MDLQAEYESLTKNRMPSPAPKLKKNIRKCRNEFVYPTTTSSIEAQQIPFAADIQNTNRPPVST